ncbi:hypothetical protein O181_013680 [Austropuccinia psidii MF-1]|uniref:Integrase catalytic domain-containing protein n=1 Tax=Austropuccinia psidii MF-1 TaxID=1389203 RepID=A0A9Q3GP62_9BASI|nr:hypothetical protein [Austropuccinia psidii MF-1]
MGTALLICNGVIFHTGLFQNFISDRDAKFTSDLWTNLHSSLGTKLSFSTAYHSQTDGLSERMIQTLEDMMRNFCACRLEFKYYDGFTHESCTLIPALELAYKTSIPDLTGKTPAMLEKGWNPKLPVDSLKKDLVDLHTTVLRFKIFLDKLRKHDNKIITYAFEYSKQKLEKIHKDTEFKVLDLILFSALKLNNIKGPKKLKDSFS